MAADMQQRHPYVNCQEKGKPKKKKWKCIALHDGPISTAKQVLRHSAHRKLRDSLASATRCRVALVNYAISCSVVCVLCVCSRARFVRTNQLCICNFRKKWNSQVTIDRNNAATGQYIFITQSRCRFHFDDYVRRAHPITTIYGAPKFYTSFTKSPKSFGHFDSNDSCKMNIEIGLCHDVFK